MGQTAELSAFCWSAADDRDLAFALPNGPLVGVLAQQNSCIGRCCLGGGASIRDSDPQCLRSCPYADRVFGILGFDWKPLHHQWRHSYSWRLCWIPLRQYCFPCDWRCLGECVGNDWGQHASHSPISQSQRSSKTKTTSGGFLYLRGFELWWIVDPARGSPVVSRVSSWSPFCMDASFLSALEPGHWTFVGHLPHS